LSLRAGSASAICASAASDAGSERMLDAGSCDGAGSEAPLPTLPLADIGRDAAPAFDTRCGTPPDPALRLQLREGAF
jgi:hypothetical protein